MDQIRKIAKAIDTYANKTKVPNYDELIAYAAKQTGSSVLQVEDVVKFLQDLQGVSTMPVPLEAVKPDMSKPLDLAYEIHFNYAVAKALLERTLNTTMPDSEEVRKTLREISRFLETMLKMQERVFNVQQVIKFQDAVFDILETVDPELKKRAVEAILEYTP